MGLFRKKGAVNVSSLSSLTPFIHQLSSEETNGRKIQGKKKVKYVYHCLLFLVGFGVFFFLFSIIDTFIGENLLFVRKS